MRKAIPTPQPPSTDAVICNALHFIFVEIDMLRSERVRSILRESFNGAAAQLGVTYTEFRCIYVRKYFRIRAPCVGNINMTTKDDMVEMTFIQFVSGASISKSRG